MERIFRVLDDPIVSAEELAKPLDTNTANFLEELADKISFATKPSEVIVEWVGERLVYYRVYCEGEKKPFMCLRESAASLGFNEGILRVYDRATRLRDVLYNGYRVNTSPLEGCFAVSKREERALPKVLFRIVRE